jgi:amino acid transporter
MQPAHPVQGERALVRAIGVRGLTASIVNTTVGAGIFVLPALVARDLGTAAPLAYLACGFAMTLVVASFAMAGSRVSLTGGIYAYVEVAFGPFVGFLTGVLVWLACLLAAASVASALASSVGLVMPVVSSGAGRAALLGAVFASFVAINIRGVALGTRVIELVTVAKLLPLALLLAVGIFWIDGADLAVRLASPDAVGTTSITLIFAFVGVEVALVPSGEIRDPARTVPRALFLALGFTTLLYLALQLVSQAALGSELASFPDAPLAEVASRVLGHWGASLMLAGGMVSMLGFLAGDALGSPRSLFAFGRDGLLPSALARVHPRFRTPWPAIVAHGLCAWTAACIGTFGVLTLMSNVALLSCYLLCCAAAIELSRRDVQAGGLPFRIPGGPLVPAAACVVLLWLLSHATAREFVVTGATAAAAACLYALRAVRGRRALARAGAAGAAGQV